ncbi:beta-glucosidase [Agreia bicolorata]|uniref:Exo-alpha-(1->6)-L-arabinopyranosidase n=1 Tax=Agreia bicolorata TaxID=110935 RepID=A0A1T4WSH8_9MICO|nr:glycoside hydrolase family 3 C-terminal domain-containing protein [Agreia bicolorata]KJC64225.1 beta-glucosidase [Agreia bicolorata]SKA80296.1 beta-glucosidase [Agreia bicolorata]
MHTPITSTSAGIANLTLEEKASLTSGGTFWSTKPIESIGLREITLTDGPHGLRRQDKAHDHLGIAQSLPSTCFPPAAGLGSSWDVELIARVAEAIGREARALDVDVVLGPGANIKRSPLCGRNFEYFSEDPIASGTLSAAWVQGIQATGVGASLKHFAANNQEFDRMRSSSDIDERPLREIYLRSFQRVVQDAHPYTVMCSYNRINGVYASQDPWLLTSVLRDEWGFDGLVVSDWGAVDDRVAAIAAGMDLEMPPSGGRSDQEIVDAVESGSLDAVHVDAAAQRLWELAEKTAPTDSARAVDVDAHHALAREAAGRSIVLLKNDDDLLPLSRDEDIAVIGAFAEQPRYQGSGSSNINPTRLDKAIDEMRSLSNGTIEFAAGFSLEKTTDTETIAALREEAVHLAAAHRVVVVFAGLPGRAESEGLDRSHLDLPQDQLDLIEAIIAVNPRVVVVLSNGSVVRLPFAARVPAILEAWLLGQAGGGGTADVIFGDVNPSGKLTETLPLRLQDTPAFLSYGGEFSHVRYSEGLFVGYRWYDARDMDVAFPFGHGLSYTSFSYGEPTAVITDDGDIDVTVSVTNTGARAGREVVQVYSSIGNSSVQRPVRELKAFGSVELEPGGSATVTMRARRADLAYWHPIAQQWVVEGGLYTFVAASSSRDLRGEVEVEVVGDEIDVALTRDSSLAEAMAHPVAGPLLAQAMGANGQENASAADIFDDDSALQTIMGAYPLGRIAMMGVSSDMLDQVLAASNAQR